MLQKLAGLLLVFIGAVILTVQVFAGADDNVLWIFGGFLLTIFGTVVNLESGKEKPRERL